MVVCLCMLVPGRAAAAGYRHSWIESMLVPVLRSAQHSCCCRPVCRVHVCGSVGDRQQLWKATWGAVHADVVGVGDYY